MPYLILSDIHANLEAHQAVLEDARGQYDRILCLGDLVGYGADPNAIVEWARENVTAVIRGNHDRVSAAGDPQGAGRDGDVSIPRRRLRRFGPAARCCRKIARTWSTCRAVRCRMKDWI